MKSFTIAANQGDIGGGEVMLFAIAEAARDLGRNVTVVAPSHPGTVVAQAKARGFRTIAIRSEQGTAQYLRNLRRWDKRHRRGLLWCNGLRPAVATAGQHNRIVELHQRPAGGQQALANLATRGALRVVVPSASMADANPAATVLWNWSQAVERRPRPVDTPITLGFLGRLSSDKGVVVLCKAFQQLMARHPGRFRLLLAGESRFVDEVDAARVRSAIASLGSDVETPGWIDREEFFDRVDLAVFPSLVEESFGLVVTEAMSAGVPFVVSDAGALAEVAGEGWICAAGDAGSLARTVEAACEDLDRFVEQGRRRWVEHFSPTAGRERLDDLLMEVAPPREPHIALAHDYLTQRGGAERVALELTKVFPEATLHTALHAPEHTYPEFSQVAVRTSTLNRSHLLRRSFRLGLPLFGLAFENLPVEPRADAVVVSTTAFAHGIRTKGRKIVYCHSPARFLYLIDEYLGKPWWRSLGGWGLMALRPALLAWDKRAAASADVYLCNSTVVRDRIRDVYGLEAKVLAPPASLDPAGAQEPVPELADWPDHHVLVSRLLPYKNVDVAIAAFRGMPEERLLIIGRGPQKAQLAADLPPNVRMAEGLSDAQMRHAYATARAVVAPSFEDFGLTPIEGFSFGVPTLALRAGGYLDTVVEGVTGYFFDRPQPTAVAEAVRRLRAEPLHRERIVEHSHKYSPEHFAAQLRSVVNQTLGLATPEG